MAVIDREYHKLLKKILDEGRDKGDRTGTGTISIHEDTLRYNMANGFPLLTTKKMFTKGVITELLWFLSGSTDLRELVEQRNNIWVGDAYKRYEKHIEDMNMTERENGDPKHILSRNEFIERIIKDNEFNKQWGDLGPIYGKQWVAWEKINYYDWGSFDKRYRRDKDINQVQNVIDTLRTNPDSRRMLVTAWNPADIDDMILPPCHWAFEFYTEELTIDERIEISTFWHKDEVKQHLDNSTTDTTSKYVLDKLEKQGIPKRRISLKWHQRSVDTPLGLPFNIASYAFLLEMVAQQVNMVPHMLVGDLSNVHIYQNQLDGVREQLNNFIYEHEAPKLKLNKAEDLFSYKLEDFEIEGYESYPTIKFPLSN